MNAAVAKAIAVLEAADALLITAGAGIGVDSGLPDFRGTQGFWKAYPALAARGTSFVQIANPRAFETDPRRAWAFYGHRLDLYRRTVPHAGFDLLLQVARSKRGGFFVFTSNVDGQFQKAGFPPDMIVECHGSIHHLQCCRPCCRRVWEAGETAVDVGEADFLAREPLPICPRCGGLARPNILMFDDGDWIEDRMIAQRWQMAQWLDGVTADGPRLVIVEIGAGAAIPTVRNMSEAVAREPAAVLIRINPRDHQVPDGHVAIPLGAMDGIRAITASSP